MIHVERGDPPADFHTHATQWMTDYSTKHTQNISYTVTKHWDSIRSRKVRPYAEILKQRFNHKCAFCESADTNSSPLHIEHFYPKNKDAYVDRVYNWNNWLVACHFCNHAKGTELELCNGIPCLVNPCDENPEDHLFFTGVFIHFKDTRGDKTITCVDLKRDPLEKKRSEHLVMVKQLLVLARFFEHSRDIARLFLIWALQDDAPYTAMTRCFLQEWTPKLVTHAAAHPRVHFDDPLKQIDALLDQYKAEIQALEW